MSGSEGLLQFVHCGRSLTETVNRVCEGVGYDYGSVARASFIM